MLIFFFFFFLNIFIEYVGFLGMLISFKMGHFRNLRDCSIKVRWAFVFQEAPKISYFYLEWLNSNQTTVTVVPWKCNGPHEQFCLMWWSFYQLLYSWCEAPEEAGSCGTLVAEGLKPLTTEMQESFPFSFFMQWLCLWTKSKASSSECVVEISGNTVPDEGYNHFTTVANLSCRSYIVTWV